MNHNLEHNIRKTFNNTLYQIARYTEIGFAIIILIVIALSGIRLINELINVNTLDMDIAFFREFLSAALSLVVGAEFVKMLCQHSAQTVVEVLLFATARQMVVEHLDMVETLIGVIAIGVLFVIHKYLINPNMNFDKRSKSMKLENDE